MVLDGQISKSDTTCGFDGNIPLDPNPSFALITLTIVFVKKKKKSKIELSHLPINTEKLEWKHCIYYSNNHQGSEEVPVLLLQPMYLSLGKDIRLF